MAGGWGTPKREPYPRVEPPGEQIPKIKRRDVRSFPEPDWQAIFSDKPLPGEPGGTQPGEGV